MKYFDTHKISENVATKKERPCLNSGTYQAISGHVHLSATKELWFVECDSQEWVLDHEEANENN